MRLDDLPPLRDVIENHGLAAKKKLGQNFLLDLNLTRKIARVAKLTPDMQVIEIGPGPGGLTRALLEQDIVKLTAIERDDRCIAALQDVIAAAAPRFELIAGDALETDIVSLTEAPRAVVANLPYNIATPLLIGWLRQISDFTSLTLMFQKEVALRITAAHGSKTYGRLSVICQWLCQCDIVFDVPASAFTPPPKVTSSIVRLVPRVLSETQPRFASVEKLTALAFQQRRKMLRQSLKTLLPDIQGFLAEAGIAETARAEALSVEDYIRLARLYEMRMDGTPT